MEAYALYQEHRDFESPNDKNTTIWRYLDLAKFISLLDTQSLFFARASVMKDPFEGSSSKVNLDLREEACRQEQASATEPLATLVDRRYGNQSKLAIWNRNLVLLNCWHMNQHESAAMWHLYSSDGQGVAIQSTFERLADSFRNWKQDVWTLAKMLSGCLVR